MIVKEFYGVNRNGKVLYKTYSDLGLKIRQVETGAIYDEAVDIEGNNFTYEETDKKVEVTEKLEGEI